MVGSRPASPPTHGRHDRLLRGPSFAGYPLAIRSSGCSPAISELRLLTALFDAGGAELSPRAGKLQSFISVRPDCARTGLNRLDCNFPCRAHRWRDVEPLPASSSRPSASPRGCPGAHSPSEHARGMRSTARTGGCRCGGRQSRARGGRGGGTTPNLEHFQRRERRARIMSRPSLACPSVCPRLRASPRCAARARATRCCPLPPTPPHRRAAPPTRARARAKSSPSGPDEPVGCARRLGHDPGRFRGPRGRSGRLPSGHCAILDSL